MDKGEIVDAGKHGELLKRCAIYANLYRIQFAGE
jgi:ABC-type multidrug transport system fused ATPase/permease subunit